MFIAAPRLITQTSAAHLELFLAACDLAAFVALGVVRLAHVPSGSRRAHALPTLTPRVPKDLLVPMIWTGVAFSCFTFDFFAFNTWVTTYFTDHFLVPLVTAGMIAAVISMVNASFNIISGVALGRPRLPWYLVFVVPAWVLSVLWIGLPYSSFPVMLISSLAIGALGGVIPTLIFAVPGKVALTSKEIPLAMSIVIIGENFGIMLGPPIFGAVIKPPHFALGFYLLAAVSVAMALTLGQVVKRVRDIRPADSDGMQSIK